MQGHTDNTAVVRLPPATRPISLVFVVAAISLILNLLDAIFTLLYVTSGVAVEANPFMDELLSRSPVWFMIGKLALVSLGVELLWRFRTRRLAVIGLVTVLILYTMLAAYHLSAIHYLIPFMS